MVALDLIALVAERHITEKANAERQSIDNELSEIGKTRECAAKVASYIPLAPLKQLALAMAIEGMYMVRHRKTAGKKIKEVAEMVRNKWTMLEGKISELEELGNEASGTEYAEALQKARKGYELALDSLQELIPNLQALWAERHPHSRFPYSLRQEHGSRAAP